MQQDYYERSFQSKFSSLLVVYHQYGYARGQDYIREKEAISLFKKNHYLDRWLRVAENQDHSSKGSLKVFRVLCVLYWNQSLRPLVQSHNSFALPPRPL
jgi:hypothetical protein